MEPYDQSTFLKRYEHFRAIFNPKLLFYTKNQLLQQKKILDEHSQGLGNYNKNQIKWARTVVYSAFHPDTGQINPTVGRISFQVPANILISGAMLTWYRIPWHVASIQWFNQSVMAFCNYTNRNATSEITNKQVFTSYAMATTAALSVSLGLNHVLRNVQKTIFKRLVPFTAVSAANCVNVPLMRQHEIISGINVTNKEGDVIGVSKHAGKSAVLQVTLTRIMCAAPVLFFPPFAMNYLNKVPYISAARWRSNIVQCAVIGVFAFLFLPVGCAVFPEKSSIPVEYLEGDVKSTIRSKWPHLKTAYYNRGL